jgi:cysteinyl-tRNA synthetase
MSMETLGEQIDIHGGGRDLKQMHHEHEIAQSESATGKKPFARFWMHNGMVKLDGTKMSKSLGNLILARNLMEEYEPDHLRLYLLSDHYRTDLDYRDGALAALSERYELLKRAAGAEADGLGLGGDALEREFLDRMEDDLDTPGALDVLDRSAGRIVVGTAGPGEVSKLRDLLAVLGFAFAGAKGPATGHLEPTTRA